MVGEYIKKSIKVQGAWVEICMNRNSFSFLTGSLGGRYRT
uniref:Uncharacterized protein n=1 Tax=Rhizophora mucronata TaxID=61149 RepID=A0A2P2Q9G1_RHIMU